MPGKADLGVDDFLSFLKLLDQRLRDFKADGDPDSRSFV